MITEKTSLTELAAIVSSALERQGIIATLSGGAAVSIYSGNRYVSEDLDFVTVALVNDIKAVLEPLGFTHTGQPRLTVFDHPMTRWYLEFPPAPLSFGGTYVDPSHCALIDTGVGELRIITPTQSIMDRLIAAAAWSEPQSLEQALLVAKHQENEIDWKQIDEFVIREGIQDDKKPVSSTGQSIDSCRTKLVGVRRIDSNRLRAILTLKGGLTRRFVRLALRAASRSKSAVLPICRRPKRIAFCELPAPASRRQ